MACNPPNKKLCLNPADLRHKIEFQSITRTENGAGGYTNSWSTFATVYAKIEPTSGWQRWQFQQLETQITHRITIRHINGITTDSRILFGVRVFDIKEIINIDERNITLEIMAIEGLYD